MASPLDDVHVVELAGSIAGAYASRLFALGGARVTLVGADSLTSSQHRYLRQHVHRVADDTNVDWSDVDVVIESDAERCRTRRPLPLRAAEDRLVQLRISPFGDTGPYASWSSTDLVDYAVSGHAYLYGDPDRAPIPGPPNQPAIAAGLHGFIGAMAALFAREGTGTGQCVDVDHFTVMAALHQVTLLRRQLTGDVLCRMGNRYTGPGQPNGPYQCRDGWVSIVGVTEPQVEGLLAVTGLLHLLELPEISSPLDFYNHPELLDVPLRRWLGDQHVDEVVELFQAMRIPACPLRTPLGLLDDPQLAAREYFAPLADDPTTKVPGPPFTFSHHQDPGTGSWKPAAASTISAPLAGLRVLDLARVWAGPLCARMLADLGADVILVEAPGARGPKRLPQSMLDATRYFPNDDQGERPWNRNGHIVKYALGKRALCLDLQTEAGVAAFEQLVPTAHVLIENFSSRVMPNFGLDEDRLHELNPDLVYLTMPGYGRSGPAEHWLAYGSCIDSHAGLSALTGYADATPWKGGVAWPDPIAGLHACAAVLTRLWTQRGGTRGGCTIESAQFEATIATIGDHIVEAQSGRRFHPSDAGGVFRCAPRVGDETLPPSDDRWIAVSWERSNDDERLRDAARRLGVGDVTARHAPLDELVSRLAVGHDASTLASTLQSAGVTAAPVHDAADIMANVHLLDTAAFATVDQPDIGPFVAPHTPISFSADPGSCAARGAAPTLGQHNAEVLSEAGLSAREIERLADTGTIATAPPR